MKNKHICTVIFFFFGQRNSFTARHSGLGWVWVCVYPLLGGLVAQVQGGGVPVHSNISITYRGSVLCTLYCAASAEPRNTHGWKKIQAQAINMNIKFYSNTYQIHELISNHMRVCKALCDMSHLYQGHQAHELPSLPTTRKVKGYW